MDGFIATQILIIRNFFPANLGYTTWGLTHRPLLTQKIPTHQHPDLPGTPIVATLSSFAKNVYITLKHLRKSPPSLKLA